MKIKKHRINYWSSSKLSNWLRKLVSVKKPFALGLEGWSHWKKDYKEANPIMYLITEVYLNKIQNVIMYPVDVYYTLKVYVINRFIDKLHYLPTNLKPGEYYEVDQRILHGLFGTLVDFVEVDCSNGGTRRDAKSGLAHLQWEMEECANTPQAEAAKVTFELYDWWVNKRPARIDSYEASGLNVFYRSFENKKDLGALWSMFSNLSSDDEIERRHLTDLQDSIEQRYADEDEEMMIKLIKHRSNLWI